MKKTDTVVVYDKIGMISAPRAFWLLKTFGVQNVMILNGSFLKWAAEKREVESGDTPNAFRKVRAD